MLLVCLGQLVEDVGEVRVSILIHILIDFFVDIVIAILAHIHFALLAVEQGDFGAVLHLALRLVTLVSQMRCCLYNVRQNCMLWVEYHVLILEWLVFVLFIVLRVSIGPLQRTWCITGVFLFAARFLGQLLCLFLLPCLLALFFFELVSGRQDA